MISLDDQTLEVPRGVDMIDMWRKLCLVLTSIHVAWVNYNELTTSSLEIIVSKGNHPQMALIQVSELL